MKTADDYIRKINDRIMPNPHRLSRKQREEVKSLIREIQKEAYNQALDDKLDTNKIHIMLSGIKIDNDNLDYIKLTGEICGNLRWDLVEAIKNLKK